MRCSSLAVALLVASTTAFAQQHGAIKGYIKDAQGAGVTIATSTEQVTVTATAPVIDVEAAVRASNINQTAISNIPVAPRVTLSTAARSTRRGRAWRR